MTGYEDGGKQEMNEMERSQAATIEPGYRVALVLKPESAPQRFYAGLVAAVDECGLRLTPSHSSAGIALGLDLFFPWESITSALVATPDHDPAHFDEVAADWYSRIRALT